MNVCLVALGSALGGVATLYVGLSVFASLAAVGLGYLLTR